MRTQAGHRRRRDDTWIMLSTACRPHSCPQSVGGRAATATRAVTAWRRLRWPTALRSGTSDSLTARRWCSPRRNGPLSCGGSRRATSAERIVWRLADNGRQRVWPGTFIIPDPLTPRLWRNGLLRGRLFGSTYFSWQTQGDAMVTTAGPVAGPVQSLPPVGTGSPTGLRILLGAHMRSLREAIVSRPNARSLWVVLDEAVLRRPIGGPATMRAQLKHLIEMSQRPNVTVQVIPFKAGGHAAAGGAFSLLRFAEHDLSDVVFLEQLNSAQYLDKPDVVDGYLAVMERLCIRAVTPAATVKILRSMVRES